MLKRIITLLLCLFILLTNGMFPLDIYNRSGSLFSPQQVLAASAVSTPVFSPAAGTYTLVQTVSISCATSGATIRYTTNGSTPTASSTAYTGPITVSSTTTIKAIAIKSGMTNSSVASATYTIAAATPTFSLAQGTYSSAQTVAISCATAGVTIRYTTNGSTPTTSSTAYTGPITVSSTITIKAMAIKSGMANSTVASATYTIAVPVATPTFDVTPGAYTSEQTVSILCETVGATIRYTTNGSTPTSNSKVYSSPITVSNTTTIKAIAMKSGMVNSSVASATYTIMYPVATPNFVTNRQPNSSIILEICCDTPGATIKYTTDGTTPNINSPTYVDTITITETSTVSAYAYLTGMLDSDINTYTYIVAQDDYGNSSESAYPIKVNKAQHGGINYPGDDDYFSFIPPITGQYSIGTSGEASTYACLYDSNGNFLAKSPNWDGRNFIFANLNANQIYYVLIKHYDYSGMGLYSVSVNTYDYVAPTIPGNLVSVPKTSSSVELSWTASTDNIGVDFYEIYDGDSKIGSTADTTYTITGLAPNTIYRYTVKAVDASGNASQPSNLVEVIVNRVSSPTFNLAEGAYIGTRTITLSCETNEAVIRYTTDGSNPSLDSPIYTEPIEISKTTTIKAYAIMDNMSDSTIVSASYTISLDTVAPSIPVNITLSSKTETSLSISWSPSTDNLSVTGYDIFAGEKLVGATKNTLYTITGLSQNTKYIISVRARDASGNISARSLPLTVLTLGDSLAPSAPANLSATHRTETSVGLKWSASTDNVGVGEYLVYINGKYTGSTNKTNITLKNLIPDTAYSFSIKARDVSGNLSQQSSVLEVKTLEDILKPTAPANLTLIAKTHSTVNLKWDSSKDNTGIVGYYIEYAGNVISVESATTSYIVTGLIPETAYTFTVKAKDMGGNESASSNQLIVSTNPLTQLLPSPANVAAISKTSTSVTLSWEPLPEEFPIAGYEIFRDYEKIATTSGIGYTDKNLLTNLTYTYTVKAVGQDGKASEPSSPVIVALTYVKNVNILECTEKTDATAVLKWMSLNEGVEITSYDIYRDDSKISSTTSLEYKDTGLTPNKAYNYRIKAMDVKNNIIYQSNVTKVLTNPLPEGWSNAYIGPTSKEGVAICENGKFFINASDINNGLPVTNGMLFVYKQMVGQYTLTARISSLTNADSSAQVGIMVRKNLTATGESIFVPISLADLQTKGYKYIKVKNSTSYCYTYASKDGISWIELNKGYFVELTGSNITYVGFVAKGCNVIFENVILGDEVDNQSPDSPTNLVAASVKSTSVELEWNPAKDNTGITAYRIYCNGIEKGISYTTSFKCEGLQPDAEYTFIVAAIDSAGNMSNMSSSAKIRTSKSSDTQIPPSAYNLILAAKTDTSVSLKWNEAGENTAGYKIYRNNSCIGSSKVLNYTDRNLTKNTQYSYYVVAFDSEGNYYDASDTVNVYTSEDQASPTTPANLEISSKTNTQISLKWGKSADDTAVAGYELYRNNIKICLSATNAFDDTGLKPNTTYKYFVKAYDAAGNYSKPSDTLTVTTGSSSDDYGNSFDSAFPIEVDETIAGVINFNGDEDYFVFVPQKNGVYTIKSSGKITTYIVVYDNNKNQIGSSDSLNYSAVNLSIGKKYFIKITAAKDSNAVNSSISASGGIYNLNIYLDVESPTKPVALYFNDSNYLCWTKSSDNLNIIYYDIFRNNIKIGTTVLTSFKDAYERRIEEKIIYNVIARDPAGNESDKSDPYSFGVKLPSQPTNLVLSQKTISSVTLTWTKSVSNGPLSCNYRVYRDGVFISSSGNPESFTDSYVVPGKTYTYRVEAYDIYNQFSPLSEPLAVAIDTDTTVPTSPSNLNVTGKTDTSVKLSWGISSDNSGVSYYEIYRDGLVAGSTTSNSFEDFSLTPGAIYTYTIKAYDRAGNISDFSAPLTVKINDILTSPINTGKQVVFDAGDRHVLATKNNGSLWAWGSNSNGQLGDGTNVNRDIPVQIGSDCDWLLVSAGSYHSAAIKNDGSLWAWGSNSNGQLGDGTGIGSKIPVQIGISTDWYKVSAGETFTIALKKDGTLWYWGDGVKIPVQIGNDMDWLSISAGHYHFMAIKKDGTLWGYGKNPNGELGDGTKISKSALTQIGTDNDWVNVSAGKSDTAAIKKDGSIWSWGKLKSSTIPLKLDSGIWTKVSAGGNSNIAAISNNGSLRVWGLEKRSYVASMVKDFADNLWGSFVNISLGGTIDLVNNEHREMLTITRSSSYIDYYDTYTSAISEVASPTSADRHIYIRAYSYYSAGDNLAFISSIGNRKSMARKTIGKNRMNVTIDRSTMKVDLIDCNNGSILNTCTEEIPINLKDINFLVEMFAPAIKENENLELIVQIINNSDKNLRFTVHDGTKKFYILNRSNHEISVLDTSEKVYIRHAAWDYFPVGSFTATEKGFNGKTGSSSANIGNKIYVTGGCNYNENGGYFKSVDVYDGGQWSTAQDMNIERTGHGAVAYNGFIYAFGGFGGSYLDTVEVYNPQINTWTIIDNKMPTRRANFGLAELNGKIYAIGGVNEFGYLNSVEVYDPNTGIWTTAGALSVKRGNVAVASVGGKIYCIGGQTEDGRYSALIEVYDPLLNQWKVLSEMPVPRCSATATAMGNNGKIYVIGGWNGENLSNVEIFDPSTNSWSFGDSLNAARHGHTSVFVNEEIYIIGGIDDNGYVDNVEIFGRMTK